MGRAAANEFRVVTLGPLVFFSTETGDGWMLDPQDGLANCLARDGDPLPVDIKETDDSAARVAQTPLLGLRLADLKDSSLCVYVSHCVSAAASFFVRPFLLLGGEIEARASPLDRAGLRRSGAVPRCGAFAPAILAYHWVFLPDPPLRGRPSCSRPTRSPFPA